MKKQDFLCVLFFYISTCLQFLVISVATSTSISLPSSSSQVNLKFLDTFTEQILEPGPSVSLRCIASGNPLPQVTWLLDGYAIPESLRFRTGDYVTRDSLLVSYVNISSVTAQDGGLYQCTASNEVSSIRHSARLKVFGPPFIRPMKNVSAVSGESILLNCPVAGHPIDGIYWEKGNQRLPSNHRQKVFPNGTFSLTDVERSADEGTYTCTALSGTSTSLHTQHSRQPEQSKASSSLYLSVLVRPVIDPFVFPRSLHQGQRYTILCSVSQGDFPITIKWFKNGKIISSASGLNPEFAGIIVIHVSPFSSNLVFDSLRPEHMGNYTCEASNSAGSVTHNGSMVIHVPPKWIIEPRDTSVLKGRTALIDCSADGFPPPSVRWSKTDGLLSAAKTNPSPEFKPVISNPHMRVFQNGSLAVNNVQRSDGASYLCQVTNGISSGLSKVITLTVHVAAHFETPKFRAITVRKGHEASLKCEAEGDPPLTISWMKDKSTFNVKDESRYELIETPTADGSISEVIIKNSDRRDSALFTCTAFNSFGSDEMNLQLIMQEPPDPPNDLKALESDGRTATISWSPPFSGNSPILSYLVQYKLDTEKWSTSEANLTVPGNENFILIRNLKPISNYHCRVFAINNLGRSESSETVPFKTDEEAPGGTPLHIKAIATSSKSVKVSWKAPRKELQHGTIKGYYVGYKIFDQESEPFIYKTIEVKDSMMDIGSRSLPDECHLHGLKRFTKYAITVQAFNSRGTGPSSEIIEVQTLQNDPPVPPTLKVSSVTKSSIHLMWSVSGSSPPTANEGRNGESNDSPSVDTITGFILHTKKPELDKAQLLGSSSANPTDWEEIRLPGDRFSYTFERLACGTKYQYFLVAFNTVGKSDPSEILSTKTEGNVPVAPDKNSLLSVNTTAAIIYLDSWHDGSCPISSFEILHKPRKSTRSKWESIRVFPASTPNSKSVIVSDLLPSTIYDLKIIAMNEAGASEAQYSFTTASLLRASGGNSLVGNEPSSTMSNVVHFDLTLLLPTTISLVLVIILIFLARIWLMKKRQLNNQFYGTVYGSQGESNKSQNGATDSLCLTGLGPSCTLKKSGNGCSSNGNDGSRIDGNNSNYPNPYELTKLNGGDSYHHHHVANGNGITETLRSQTTPLKPMQLDGSEPMYATVKRTARNPRDCHLYQYPCTINGTTGLVTIAASDSCCETDSCLSLSTTSGPPNGTTAFLRLHEPNDHLLRHENGNGDHQIGENFTPVCYPMR